MVAQRAAHWIGLVAVVVVVVLSINDAVNLQIWRADWYWLLFALAWTAGVSLLAYWIIRGIGWLVGRAIRPTDA